jgi:hypothetical protein
MSGREFVVGSAAAEGSLPPDHLTREELSELHRLTQAWEQHSQLAQVLHDRINLLLLAAKDRRGIVGPVRVDLASGTIFKEPRKSPAEELERA